MAVDARHPNVFPTQQQIISNRDFLMDASNNNGNGFSYNNNNNQMGYLPFNQTPFCDSIQPKTSLNTDSGLTYNFPTTTTTNVIPTTVNTAAALPTNSGVPKKRSRDSFNQFNAFIGDQLDIDCIISHHTKKIRMELEEKQKQHARLLMAAIGEGVVNKLKEKDEQIQKMGKLNLFLQERVKNLYLENQLWRDLAQSNEATANSLRNNLEQVLAHVSDERLSSGAGTAVPQQAAAAEEDVESCCGSSDHGVEEEGEDEVAREGRVLAGEARDGKKSGGSSNGNNRMMCRRCGERESCVLLLPCRHLCLCTVCGSSLVHNCPVCNSNMNATVHVNMSSS